MTSTVSLLGRETLHPLSLLGYMAPMALALLIPGTLLIEGNVARIALEMGFVQPRFLLLLGLNCIVVRFPRLSPSLPVSFPELAFCACGWQRVQSALTAAHRWVGLPGASVFCGQLESRTQHSLSMRYAVQSEN